RAACFEAETPGGEIAGAGGTSAGAMDTAGGAWVLVRASTRSGAVAKRAAGSRARQRRVAASQLAASPGTCTRGDGGASWSRLTAVDSALSPRKGTVPVSIS